MNQSACATLYDPVPLPPLPWHVAQVKTGREFTFARNLARIAVEAEPFALNGSVRLFHFLRPRMRALLPGYVMVRFGDLAREYERMRNEPAFVRLLRRGEGFALVHDYLVEILRLETANRNGAVAPREVAEFAVGEQVRFRPEVAIKTPDGTMLLPNAFGGLLARIEAIEAGKRITYLLELELFGRVTPVRVGAGEIEAVSAS
jgi:transcription antitermination factor NusG